MAKSKVKKGAPKNDDGLRVHYLGIGSAERIKNASTPVGLFYYRDRDGKIVFLDKRKNPLKEFKFDSIDDLEKFVEDYLYNEK